MKIPTDNELKILRMQYTPGTRICLVHMDDPYENLPENSLGTVTDVDDAGTIHVDWDCGSGLGVIKGVDSFYIVK